MKSKFLIAALLIFIFFISCNKGENKAEFNSADVEMAELTAPEPQKRKDNEKQQIPVGKFSPLASDTSASPSPAPVNTNPDWDSKIIKTASVKLEIKDFKKYSNYIHNSVKFYGAYVAQEEQTLTDEKLETAITIKVPVVQFETMMNKLPGDDGKVMEKKINTDDVTGEVVDTRGRLEAKKQMRLKYLEFLKQSKNMEEILQVQNEINSIQEQIESAAGRVNFLSHQAAFSTINLTFYQPMDGFKPTDSAPSFLTRITSAFKTGAAWISDLFVGLISVWPLLLAVFVIYFGWRRIKPSNIIAPNS
jgi:hypothetical protein